MTNNCGVYKITNLINNKFYIGSSEKIDKRFIAHISQLNRGVHNNIHLQSSWNKYGKDKFKFEIIKICQIDNLIETEQLFIDSLNPDYNILKIAGSLKGYKHTDETKEKLRLAGIGRFVSQETRDKLSKTTKGVPKPKVSISQKGRKMSEEQKQLLSKIMTGRERGEVKSTFKPVVMLDKNTNNILIEFESLKHACNYLNKTKNAKSSIISCCKGKTKTAYGYKWEYINKTKIIKTSTIVSN